MLRVLPILLLVAGAALWYVRRPEVPPPGVLAPDEPLQTAVPAEPFRHKGYHLTPVARFEGTVRVLGKKRYRNDPTASLAPYDLAVGWGPMSDTAMLERMEIMQARRLYVWNTDVDTISARSVIRHSTNIHLIPATADVERALLEARPGRVVRFEGRLVDVVSNDGTRWRTSRSRTDAGIGACEILWLEKVEVP